MLKGIRILDLTQMLAGPYATMILGDLGAEVIKIEEPGVGDRTRYIGPHFISDVSAYFISINRNKRSIALNLKNEKGREIFYELVKISDVVIDNFRPGVMERLKFDYETLKKINKRIIVCSISAFGQNGEYSDRPAFDLSIQAMSGVMSYIGEPDGTPVRLSIPMGDLAGGMYALFGIFSALYKREITGIGCKIDISLLDSLIALHTYVAQHYLVSGELPVPVGSGHQSVVPYQAFKTRDIYIVIAVYTEKFWEKLCTALNIKDLIDHPKFKTNDLRCINRDELLPILEDVFMKKTGKEWIDILIREGVPCAPINTIDKVLSDPQVIERNMVVPLPPPYNIKTLGNPVKIDTFIDSFAPPPKLGEHTDSLLSQLLGYSKEDIGALRKSGVV